VIRGEIFRRDTLQPPQNLSVSSASSVVVCFF
jgi:hypothetical protein